MNFFPKKFMTKLCCSKISEVIDLYNFALKKKLVKKRKFAKKMNRLKLVKQDKPFKKCIYSKLKLKCI